MSGERIAYFKEFQIYSDIGLNFYHALWQCKKQGINRLVVEKGIYTLDPENCSQKSLSISNHGYNGPKRIAVLIDEMENFEIDFSGSTLICNGVMVPIAVTGSRNISVKNLRLKNTKVQILQTEVIAHGDGWIDTKPLEDGNLVKIMGHKMYASCPGNMWAALDMNIEFNGTTGEIEAGTRDDTLGVWSGELKFSYTDTGILRIHGIKRYPPIGNILVFTCARRLGCGIFCENSQDISCENVDICSSYGMGILAQMCKNISLNKFNTVREDGRYFSSSADATHFVNCEGVVRVENCSFEGQFDDALNIHGIYTRIIEKGQNWLLVKEMHPEATGIKIYRAGDVLAALHPKTLIPYKELIVDEVEYINDHFIKLYFEDDLAMVQAGDNIENISRNAELIFRNNQVRDNRARGMLIATKGKVLIENNIFHTSGTAILFECDGEYWYESGSVKDVMIRNNTFDRCKHGGWGQAVIECQPRKEVEEGKYFHQNICVEENEFILYTPFIAWMDNIENLTFQNNHIVSEECESVVMKIRNVHCENVQGDIVQQ